MNSETPSNIVHFSSQRAPDQHNDPHRDVIVTLTHLIRQMNGLVTSINEGPLQELDKIKYSGWLCSASALCLRAQLEYFEQFIGGSERMSAAALSLDPQSPQGPSA